MRGEPLSNVDHEKFYITLGKHCTFVKTEVSQANQANTQTQLKTLDYLLTHEMPSETAT